MHSSNLSLVFSLYSANPNGQLYTTSNANFDEIPLTVCENSSKRNASS